MMSGSLLILLAVFGLVIYLATRSPQSQPGRTIGPQHQESLDYQPTLDDAIAEARHWIDRLGSQVLQLSGTDTASTQALADASERFNAASAQVSEAKSVRQAELAREAALEGLHYIQAAREIMGMPAGPPLPQLEGQRTAGAVSETRQIQVEGRTVTASPHPSATTPNYYPGGTVAGRPVPGGWYSEPWWQSAMRTGVWAAGSVFLFSALFGGMTGVASASTFEQGVDGDFGGDFDGADFDGDFGAGDFDGGDFGGDFGGGFGGDFGGGFDFGGFDF